MDLETTYRVPLEASITGVPLTPTSGWMRTKTGNQATCSEPKFRRSIRHERRRSKLIDHSGVQELESPSKANKAIVLRSHEEHIVLYPAQRNIGNPKAG